MKGREVPSRYRVKGLFVEEAPPVPATKGVARPPLLLLHGACHGAWCWENWLAALPLRGWHTFTMALRNHPGSHIFDRETYCRHTRVADYVEDVATITHHIGRPCVVIGHSMGGIVMQKYTETSTRSGLLPPAGMILLASAPPGNFGPIRPEALPEDQPYLPEKEFARQYFITHASPEVSRRTVDRLVGESPSVLNDYSRPPGVVVEPGSIQCPTLVISAEEDRTIVPKDDWLAGHLGAEYHLAKGMGHGLMYETGWEGLLDVVCVWLDRQFPGGDC